MPLSCPNLSRCPRSVPREPHQRLRLMDIQVVTDDVPAWHLRIRCHAGLQMGQKIFLRAPRSAKRGHQLSGHDVMTQKKAPRCMTLVFEFASLYLTGCKGQTRMFAFERLNSRQFVSPHRTLTLLESRRRMLIHPTDSSDGFLSVRIPWWSQPLADQMRRCRSPF